MHLPCDPRPLPWDLYPLPWEFALSSDWGASWTLTAPGRLADLGLRESGTCARMAYSEAGGWLPPCRRPTARVITGGNDPEPGSIRGVEGECRWR